MLLINEGIILAEKLYYKKESNGNSRKIIHWMYQMKMTWERSTKYEWSDINRNYRFWKAVRKKISEKTWMVPDAYRTALKITTWLWIMEEECKKRKKIT